MPNLYGLFKHDTEQDALKASFGRYKTYPDVFRTNSTNKMVGYAHAFDVSPWDYNMEISEANYMVTPTEPSEPEFENGNQDSQKASSSSEKTKDMVVEDGSTKHSFDVLNSPSGLILSPDQEMRHRSSVVDGSLHAKDTKHVGLYYSYARPPIVIQVLGVFFDKYDKTKHSQFIGAINRLLLENGVLQNDESVTDVFDFYDKKSLLQMSAPHLKKVSAVSFNFERAPKVGASTFYGTKDKQSTTPSSSSSSVMSFDEFSQKVKKAFSDVGEYFDNKFEKTRKTDENKRRHRCKSSHQACKPWMNNYIKEDKALNVKCTACEIRSKYANRDRAKSIDRFEKIYHFANIVNIPETTPQKALHIRKLWFNMKPKLCDIVADYLAKIHGKMSYNTPFDMKQNYTFCLHPFDDVRDARLLKSVEEKRTHKSGKPKENPKNNKDCKKVYVSTTFEHILKFFFEHTTVPKQSVGERPVLHAMMNGIQLYANTKNQQLKTQATNYAPYLKGAFMTDVFKKLVRVVKPWIDEALGKSLRKRPGKSSDATSESFTDVMIWSIKLKKSVKMATMYLKEETSKNKLDTKYRELLKAFSTKIAEFTKKVKEANKVQGAPGSGYEQSYELLAFDCDSLKSTFSTLLEEMRANNSVSESLPNTLKALVDVEKKLTGLKTACDGLCGTDRSNRTEKRNEIEKILLKIFDYHIKEETFVSLFEFYATAGNLDENQEILDYIKKSQSGQTPRVKEKKKSKHNDEMNKDSSKEGLSFGAKCSSSSWMDDADSLF